MNLTEADRLGSPARLLEPGVRSLLNRVSRVLTEHNVESYAVGGWVRDVLLERDTADIDIAVAADALETAARVATALGGKYVPLDVTNRVARVVLVNQRGAAEGMPRELDFATFRGSIAQDLARRDFTIDALAIELHQVVEPAFPLPSALKESATSDRPPGLIDPFHGWDDLRQGVLRAVAEDVFESDAVRLLRAVRLAAELNFSIEKKTEALIRRDSSLIGSVAGERVREELLRLLAIRGNGRLWSYLDELGLLTAVFPEMVATRGVEQPREHFWDVLEHSLWTVAAVDYLLRQGDWEYATVDTLASVPWPAGLAEHFEEAVSGNSTRRQLLKLAALLHDVRKPQTRARDGHRIRFLGHAGEGAAIAARTLERLRFSHKEIMIVETAIRHHLRPSQMSQGDELPTPRAIYRYFRDTAGTGSDILFLNLADHLATRGPHLEQTHWQEHARLVSHVLTRHGEQETAPIRLVNGHDLINLFAMRPGPAIGEILETVREAQAAGEITTRQEALKLVRRLRRDITQKDTDGDR